MESALSTAKIGLGHFLPGGTPLAPGVRGIAETYRGWIEVDQSRVQAYVKFLYPWEVFNEALGSILCQLVGLPTPHGYIVLVEQKDYPGSPIFRQTNTDRILAFASHAMPMQTLGRHITPQTDAARRELASNWKEWPDVLVFDQWIANPDRHLGNLLIGNKGKIYLIDHGMAFGRRNWSPEQLKASIPIVTASLWTAFLEKLVTLPERVAATQRIQVVSTKCSSVNGRTAMESTLVSQFLPSAQLEALVMFLHERGSEAGPVIAKVIGIPDLALGGRHEH